MLLVAACVGTPSASLAGETIAAHVIILGGGKDARQRKAWEKKRSEELAIMSSESVWAIGYPQRMASHEMKGLKPGFQILVGGVCRTSDVRTALAGVREHIPEAYTRKVEVAPDAVGCPEFVEDPEAATLAPFLTFQPRGAMCDLMLIDVRSKKKDKRLGSVDGECPRDANLSLAPGGKRLLASYSVGYRTKAFELDVAKDKVSIVPTDTLKHLELVGYGEDGFWMAAEREQGELRTRGGGQTVLEVGGRDVEVWKALLRDAEELGSPPELCRWSRYRGGKWKKAYEDLQVFGEGTAPPFCFSDELDVHRISSGFKGGHGEFRGEDLSEGDVTSLRNSRQGRELATTDGVVGQRLAVDGRKIMIAAGYQLLEGVHLQTPAWIETRTGWKAIELKRGALSLAARGPYVVACGGDWKIVNAGGKVLRAGGAGCPLPWPPKPEDGGE